MTDGEIAFRAAINVLRDSIETGCMPSGIALEPLALAVHEAAITAFEHMLSPASGSHTTNSSSVGDVELIAACDEAAELIVQWNNEPRGMSDALNDRYQDEAHRLEDRAANMRATTLAGLAAKARLLLAAGYDRASMTARASFGQFWTNCSCSRRAGRRWRRNNAPASPVRAGAQGTAGVHPDCDPEAAPKTAAAAQAAPRALQFVRVTARS